MTQEDVQFSGAVCVGSVRAYPACLIGRRVTLLSGTPSPSSSNKASTKVSLSAFSTKPKVANAQGNLLHKCPLLL